VQRTFRDGRPPVNGFIISDKPVAEDMSSVALFSRILFVLAHGRQLPTARGAPGLDAQSQTHLGEGESNFKR
jgi:hypothetical protein